MTTITIPFKKGDTFSLSCTYMIDGVASALPNGVTSQVRKQDDTLVAELIATITDAAAGTFTLTYADTTLWPVDLLNQDIQFTDLMGNIMSTYTFIIQVLKDITHV